MVFFLVNQLNICREKEIRVHGSLELIFCLRNHEFFSLYIGAHQFLTVDMLFKIRGD